MGWTSYSRWNSPKTREEERAEIVRLHTTLVDTAPYTAECLMASKVGSTWYAAIRLTPKPGREIAGPVMSGCVPDENGAITYAGVVLTDRHGGEWGYKEHVRGHGPDPGGGAAQALVAALAPRSGRPTAMRRHGASAWRPITRRGGRA